MPRGAKRSARTWDDPLGVAEMPDGPSMRPVVAVVMFAGALLTAGCSSSSPRFASGHREPAAPARHGPRFTSKEAEEEARENDRKVEPKEIERITAGARDFRREKNPAIPPLNESKLMRQISRYMGVPYVHGGASEEGMDCSGYTMAVYRDGAGVKLPRTAHEQAAMGQEVGLKDLKFGDLLFFNTTGTPASHVGIYLGDDLFAHASVTLGVTISSLQSSYYERRVEGARRIIRN
jgi:cell wall-associated NlpC family hydrolase